MARRGAQKACAVELQVFDVTEVGKAEKTIFLCEFLPSREVQREVHEGLNVA